MIINLKRVDKIIAENKGNLIVPTFQAQVKEISPLSIHGDWMKTVPSKPGQLNPLWHEFDKMKVERAKLSNQLLDKVKAGTSSEELKILVDSIKDFQPRLENLFDQARHVDQYGTLPKIEVKQEESTPEQKPW